ncbi:alpha/beta fold hydrolase [Streptomyces sp. CBMA123]|uniref:alpha/beta fold hydrolase n=1 Tax=Streptomyces sp. CBMA123 TaxID=1896313 RepID=UPI0016620FC2|nr:alpha/beta hydrolase [Streptomyces sp. CBMA123]MBD0694614.1 alpha/beta hydrolase [Streptomyces sp. CBMA123]
MIDRRTFTRAVGLGVGATAVSLGAAANASGAAATGAGRPGRPAPVIPTVAPGTHTAFPALRQVRAGVLDIGYAEAGPKHGPVVVCLHGWPYDIHSYVDVAPLLADAGYRVIVPYLRGHGSTTFLSPTAVRNAQQSAVALDVIALLDALGIHRAVLAGFDWGARTAAVVAALWPERVKALVSVGGYLVTDVAAQRNPLPAKAEHTWWYQYYFATDRGRTAMETRQNRHDLARLVWTEASPTWHFDDATFERTAAAFENPDYPAVVVHNYRWRLGLADGERRYDRYEQLLAARPPVTVPTVTLDPALDPFLPSTDGTGYRGFFTGPYEHRVLAGVGHDAPQEAPTAFAQAVVDADRL